MSETSVLFAMHAVMGSQIGRATRTPALFLATKNLDPEHVNLHLRKLDSSRGQLQFSHASGANPVQQFVRGQAEWQREPDCLTNCMQHV